MRSTACILLCVNLQQGFRVLLELSTNEDPMWKYFDSQHTYIMRRMKEIHTSSAANVMGKLYPLRQRTFRCSPFEAVYERTRPRVSRPSDLTDLLVSELSVCVPLLESKQGEATIGNLR